MQDTINTDARLPLKRPSAGATQELADRMAYWRKQLAGKLPAIQLCSEHAGPSVRVTWETLPVALASDLSAALRALSRQEGVPLFVILLGAFDTLLYRYTGEEDILVGALTSSPNGGAKGDSSNGFLKAVPLRVDLSGNPSFRELLERVGDVTLGAFSHEVPFQDLLQELKAKHELSRTPLFQVIFSLLPPLPVSGLECRASSIGSDSKATEQDLHLEMHDGSEGLTGHVAYNAQMFSPAAITRMLGHWQVLLNAIVADPGRRIGELPILTDAERHQLLVAWNDTKREYPQNTCVHDLIEAQVERTPTAVAIVFEDRQMSYEVLNAKANQLAHYLRKLGVGPDVLVGMCVDRSLEMVIGILGILKAGGAYMPLDPEYPKERLAVMLDDSNPPVVLTQHRYRNRLPGNRAHVLCLDSGWDALAKESCANPVRQATPKNLAYVIYTSGSTGKPKGVLNVHEGIVNRLLWMQDAYGLTGTDRVLQKTPYTFDVSVWEFLWPLMTGASLVIARPNGHKDPAYLVSLITGEKITTLHFVPSMLQVFLQAGDVEKCITLRRVICSGEALPFELQQCLFARLSAELHNLYGPTEAAVEVTYWACRKGGKYSTVPIGRPIANTQIYLLDKHLQPVPVGVPGELHIGGIGLARGYLNRPELTAEKFILNPFDAARKSRLYKTGDLARFLPDGNIEYLGRIDHQVKLRGFRVELGEIEAVLRQHGAVSEAVVVVREDVPGDKRLVAYMVAAPGASPSAKELRDFLGQKLPEYMVPSRFTFLEALPLTFNGKVDRRALPPPEQVDTVPRDKFVAPRDAVEFQLVKMWEKVLRVRPIGVSDDFFELGGHSLLAVRLMNQMHRQFNLNVPLATMFQAPSIERLAAILRQEGWSPAWSSLVPIQAGGSKLPLFCVHGAGGMVTRFYDLARYLGADQPVYGLLPQGLNPGCPCHTRVEEMASHYIREVRSLHPEGPYFLGGYSFGGIVAFEMAQQLTAQNQEVPVVVLFDTFSTHPDLSRETHASARKLAYLLQGISSAPLEIFQVSAGQRWAYCSRKARAIKGKIRKRVGVMTAPRIVKDVRRACNQAAGDYIPRVYPGRVILFRSSERPLMQFRDPHAGWTAYAGQGLEIHEIAGDHDNILLEPQVRLVAEQLKACLDSAEAADHVGQLRTHDASSAARVAGS